MRQLVQRAALGVQPFGGGGDLGAGVFHRQQGGGGVARQGRQGGDGRLQPFGDAVDAAGRFCQLRDGDVNGLLVFVRQHLIEPRGGLFGLDKNGLALLEQFVERAGLQRNARRVVVVGRQALGRFAVVVELDKAQAGHALRGDGGKRGRGHGRGAVDGHHDQHIAFDFFIEPDAFDLADRNAAKAHGGLRLQAGDGLAGAHFVQVALDVVAREPEGQQRQQSSDDHHEHAGNQRMGLVFHDENLSMSVWAGRSAAPWHADRVRPGKIHE